MSTRKNLIVISPHLDDGVFSCGNLLAACPQAVVVTVFAGIPEPGLPAPEWDRHAAFPTAAAAMQARRNEDREALERLDASPVWLDFFDSQYGLPTSNTEIAKQLEALLEQIDAADATLVAPLGLFHSDHVMVQEAALLLWRGSSDQTRWLFYEDALYRRLAGQLQQRLSAWYAEGIMARPLDWHIPQFAAAKAHAAQAYASQLALFDSEKLSDLATPERYWQLQCQPT